MKYIVLLITILFYSKYIDARDPFLSPQMSKLLQHAEHDPVTQYEIGRRYYIGDGVGTDKTNGVEWLKKSANAGYVLAQKALGMIYLDGDGDIVASPVTGLDWLTKAAENEDPEAQVMLAKIYREGKLVTTNYVKAKTWAMRAAKQNNADALYLLATLHHFGFGTIADLSVALKYYQQAAEKGQVDAWNNLGGMYLAGMGVKQNVLLGYAYWLVAQQLGSEIATQNINIKNEMQLLSPAEIEQAKQIAKQLLPTIKSE